MEVSCPSGVKFTSKDDNAIGYIERDGEVYTVPVNQGQYKSMMAEVAKNQGLSLNVAQVVKEEERSTDSVAKVAPKTQAQNVGLDKAKAKASEPVAQAVQPAKPLAVNEKKYVERFNMFSDNGIVDENGKKTGYDADKDITQKSEIIKKVIADDTIDPNSKKALLSEFAKQKVGVTGDHDKERFRREIDKLVLDENNKEVVTELNNILSTFTKIPEVNIDAPDKDKDKLARAEPVDRRREGQEREEGQALAKSVEPKRKYMTSDGFSEGVSVGGFTGSLKVTKGNKTYQLKPSILDKKDQKFTTDKGVWKGIKSYVTRQVKGSFKDWKDHENFGEVIGANIAAALAGKGDPKLIPELSLVYNKDKNRVMVASEYLGNESKGEKTLGNIDGYAETQGVAMIGAHGIHVKKVTTRKGTNQDGLNGEFNLSGEANKQMRKDLARGIALSAIIGDHDVNPGNMMVIKTTEGNRIARIDFGHAFNELLSGSKTMGGKVRNNDNRVLDFINREKVTTFPRGHTSKFWRDYDIMPSIELAEAFKELSSPEKTKEITEGINNAKASFKELIDDLQGDPEANKDAIKHITDSLIKINSNAKGDKIQAKDPEGIMNEVFGNLEKFCSDNQKQMGDVGKLMEMQVNIDKLIENKRDGEPLDESLMTDVRRQYQAFTGGPGVKGIGLGAKDQGIEWCKLDKKNKAFKGTLESYINNRTKTLGLNKEFSASLVAAANKPISEHDHNPNLGQRTKIGSALQDQAKKLHPVHIPSPLPAEQQKQIKRQKENPAKRRASIG